MNPIKGKIVVAEECDTEALLTAVQRTFPYQESSTGETMAQALNLLPSQYLPYSEIVCARATRSRSTILCKDDDNRVLGFLIGWDYLSTPNFLNFPIHPKMRPIIDLIEQLDQRYTPRESLSSGVLFHLYMMGVLPETRGRKIAEVLMEAAMVLAARQGYRKAVAECTGKASQKLALGCGFETLGAIRYHDFLYGGEQVFADLPEDSQCVMVEKTLNL